jgi:hypothetical protein
MSQCHNDHILAEIYSLHGTGDRRRLIVRVGNAKPHVAQRVKKFMDDHNLRSAPHAPYSMDLAPSDVFRFGYLMEVLQEAKFPTVDELLEAVA